MSEAKPVILVVEDDLDVAEMLTTFFRAENYEVLSVNWGEDALRSANATLPSLVILDIRLPDIDGFEVARRMRTSRRTKDIPILFLTEKRERQDRLRGLELGADDYITKPFDIQELRLRVKNSLWRCSNQALANPVTQLPDGSIVVDKLHNCLNSDGWAIYTVSLDNLDRFREQYGFIASDDVLRAVGLIIQNTVRETVGDGFIGHLSMTQFIVITTPGILPDLSNRLRARLDQSLEYFYPLRDQPILDDKNGKLSLRLGKLSASQGPFHDLAELRSKLACF